MYQSVRLSVNESRTGLWNVMLHTVGAGKLKQQYTFPIHGSPPRELSTPAVLVPACGFWRASGYCYIQPEQPEISCKESLGRGSEEPGECTASPVQHASPK